MDPRKMMGFETSGDQRVSVSVREWNAMKLAIWRSKDGWGVVARAASTLLARCKHEKDCPGEKSETESCFAGCPDREMRLDALVILNAARTHAPAQARSANEPYFAPTREYFSEVIAELGATQIERDTLREMLRSLGADTPSPPLNTEPVLFAEKISQFTEEDLAPPAEEEAEGTPNEIPT